jgi:aspartate/methionine/tyrosine aminotransferase
VLERTRGIIRKNWIDVEKWLKAQDGEFTWRAPDAGAIVWTKYRSGVNSSALAETLRVQHDVLIVPGDQFAMDGYIRLGFGSPIHEVMRALEYVGAAFKAVGAAT